MFVCLCSGITDSQIRAAASSGCDTLKQLREEMALGAGCGKCLVHAAAVLREERAISHTPATRAALAVPVYYWPQPA
ncbi:MAG: bacterioferritin-associated ferredoxin [Alcanivoracaceae bacterium]|jgi:bacterioferritin-associated ferredoxin|nr:bacterioferritin-associated ferredoxin [Alcanivoracaceae bacterium]